MIGPGERAGDIRCTQGTHPQQPWLLLLPLATVPQLWSQKQRDGQGRKGSLAWLQPSLIAGKGSPVSLWWLISRTLWSATQPAKNFFHGKSDVKTPVTKLVGLYLNLLGYHMRKSILPAAWNKQTKTPQNKPQSRVLYNVGVWFVS